MYKEDQYDSFARVYDTFMDNVPYDEWEAAIIKILKKYDISGGLCAELGCGTGAMTRRLSAAGFDMIGIDNSEEMLSVAREQEGQGILYLLQDMREFELYGTVGSIVSVCDSINYILDKDELLTVFKLVNNYLDPGGIFIFDFNTPVKYAGIGSSVIAENREDASFIWENEYDGERSVNEMYVTFYLEDETGKYDRYEEVHIQRGYTVSEIKELIEESGLEYIDAYDDYSEKPADNTAERVTFVCREKGKRP